MDTTLYPTTATPEASSAHQLNPHYIAPRAGGFCGVWIEPECLRITSDGMVRVALSVSAEDWFTGLTRWGEVWHVTRNSVVVLGQRSRAPVLEDWRDPVRPRDALNRYALNLAEYASVCAFRDVTEMGEVYGLEVRDLSGTGFERFLLPMGRGHEAFGEWVASHQCAPESAGSWFPPNHGSSAQWRAGLAGRIPWLRQRWIAGHRDVRRLATRRVARLLGMAAGAGLPLRVTSYHAAQNRTVIWTARGCEEGMGWDGSPGFLEGDDTGLCVKGKAMGSAWLWRGSCSCCGAQQWTVEVADTRGTVSLALKAADDSGEETWRDCLRSCYR